MVSVYMLCLIYDIIILILSDLILVKVISVIGRGHIMKYSYLLMAKDLLDMCICCWSVHLKK